MPTIRERAATALRSLAYPPTCAGCGARGIWLCDVCAQEPLSIRLPGICLRCGVPIRAGHCACADIPPVVEQVVAPWTFDGWVRTAIHRAKFQGEPHRADHLGSLLSPYIASFGRVDLLIPVPLHPDRQQSRGYNQARILADSAARAFGVPVTDALVRTRNTIAQSSLAGAQRHANMTGVFTLAQDVVLRRGAHVVIVDDVLTTGSTVTACAHELQAVAPASIGVLTVARDQLASERRVIRDANIAIMNGADRSTVVRILASSGPPAGRRRRP